VECGGRRGEVRCGLLGAIGAGGGGFGGRAGLPSAAGHVGLGAEPADQQVGHREIDIEGFPVQASATTQYLNLVELVFGRTTQSLRELRKLFLDIRTRPP
jgi:hypothetical protein